MYSTHNIIKEIFGETQKKVSLNLRKISFYKKVFFKLRLQVYYSLYSRATRILVLA